MSRIDAKKIIGPETENNQPPLAIEYEEMLTVHRGILYITYQLDPSLSFQPMI